MIEYQQILAMVREMRDEALAHHRIVRSSTAQAHALVRAQVLQAVAKRIENIMVFEEMQEAQTHELTEQMIVTKGPVQ